MNVGFILTGQTLFEETLSLEQVKTLLARMNRLRVLEICADLNLRNRRIALLCGRWQNEQGARALERFYGEFLKPNRKRKEVFFRECRFKNFTPFSEVALNALFCLACAFCRESGGDQMYNIDRKHDLIRVLLAIQNVVSPSEGMTEALKAGEFESVFPLACRSILAHRCLQSIWEFDLGRLFAFASEPAIGKQLLDKAKITIDDFFKHFGLPTADYQIMFSILWSYTLKENIVDIDSLAKGFKGDQEAFRLLVNMATSTPDKIAATVKDFSTLEDAIFANDTLITHPLIGVPTGRLVPSCSLLFNKFLRGFPYLALQSPTTPDETLTDSKAKQRGEPFGHIFEGYMVWLMRQWFDRSDVQVIENYWVSPDKARDDWPQGDLVLIFQGVAVALEISTSRLDLSFRKTGSLDNCVERYRRVTKQAWLRAKALVDGRAFHNKDLKTPLPKVVQAFPCAIVFEFLPFAQPYCLPFEKRMETELGERVFQATASIGPLQYFDVQQIEEWDEVFPLPDGITALFAAIRDRANSLIIRYQGISAFGGRAGRGKALRPGIVRKKFLASENALQDRMGRIVHQADAKT